MYVSNYYRLLLVLLSISGIANLFLTSSALQRKIIVYRASAMYVIRPLEETYKQPYSLLMLPNMIGDDCIIPLVPIAAIRFPACGAEMITMCFQPGPAAVTVCTDCGVQYHRDCVRVYTDTFQCGCVMKVLPRFKW